MSRIAVIDKQKCNPEKCENLCIRLCPINRTEKECIILREDKAVIDEDLCTGCGICPNRCPFGAISIINLPAELNQEPLHRYGENEFALFNIPIPKFGKVVGLLGQNGVGKSTALNILSGNLIPNLGNYNKEPTYEEVLQRFKGTEAQAFFEQVKDKKIKISYKPQNIDQIPKFFDGTVKQLLEKTNETNKLESISKKLGIKKILDRDIKKVSGGELQRIAIAATVLKKANVYFFDEPSSFLDIKQRIIVSKFIRDLATEETAVLVVEHDLIILDYMTDLIHVVYGKPATYGIVSQPKVTRVGINAFLEGYMKEENIRFRDTEIKFDTKPPTTSFHTELLTSWENINITLGTFNLTSTKGEINRNEIIGVLGENGIGKTSFVKILANEIKSKGIKEEVKVAYKPQHLDNSSNELVMSFLHDAMKFQTQFRHLNLKPLLMKQINQLSGGELQKVYIAKTLSQDADLFLLDEPSAYLDVEQRLLLSKIIRSFMEEQNKTCLIVDHDILFMDYISDKLMVFDGKSSIKGIAKGPYEMKKGMSNFLAKLNITMRRDLESQRPRINKPNSVKDREQKLNGNYYYS